MRKPLSALALLLVIVVASPTSATSAEQDAGWVDLLPNNSLATHWTTKGNWSIDGDGVVSLVPRPGEQGWQRYDAYLWLDVDYKNFEFEFDYNLQPHGNSGFYFHVGDVNDPVKQGIEVQIYDSHGQTKLTDHTSGGVIPRVPPTLENAKPAGEWNHFRITCKGELLTVELNGKVVNEVDLTQAALADRPRTGTIGFQDHGLPMQLRKMRVRKLP